MAEDPGVVLDASIAPAVATRRMTSADLAAVAALEAAVFGPGRYARTAYRVREGASTVSPFCRAAFAGDGLVASLRMTPIRIGGSGPHLLLGPLAVVPDFAGHGHGRALVVEALDVARSAGIGVVTLVGDLAYYDRFGFIVSMPGTIVFPGPVDPARILVLELEVGARATARGPVVAAERFI